MKISLNRPTRAEWLTMRGSVKRALAGLFKNLAIITLIGGLWNQALLADSTNQKIRVLLFKEGMPVWVEREMPATPKTSPVPKSTDEAIATMLQKRLLSQLFGPTETELSEGFSSFLPAGSQLDKVAVVNGHAAIYLTLPASYLENLDAVSMDFLADLLSKFVDDIQQLQSIAINARAFDTLEYQPLRDFLPPLPPTLDKPQGKNAYQAPTPRLPGEPSVVIRQAQPRGALSNASIFLSPGHGWYKKNDWITQRGETHNIIEDHSNAETVFQNLVQYLWNAGARVYTTRERDMNTNMVIVDNEDEGYSETGSWVTFRGGSSYKDSARYAKTVKDHATATATFTPTIPEDGYYAVYVWYPTRLSESDAISTKTQITIHHTGDATVWTQNQNRDGMTWKYIGTYYFQAGRHPETGSVVISNANTSSKQMVVADAVRFGGGIGTSGHPRWEESGLAYMKFMGNYNARHYNRVTALPAYAAWEYEPWEEDTSIYVSWHTNAGGGTGTESYAYSSAGIGGRFNGVPGSLALRDAIHEELLNDIRTGWDANWVDRGKRTNWYGELSPKYNNKMPSTIIEIGFHDNVADANAIKEPNFRRLTARAVYQGIVKFYSKHMTGFKNSKLLPEPPTHLLVVNEGYGRVTLAWDAPLFNAGEGLLGDAATGYRVYRSTLGKGFDNGIDVVQTSITLNDLTPGEVYYFRVTATNVGGESFPTETLAVRVRADSGKAPILIVNGFDRLDRHANSMEENVARGYLDRMNSHDYIISYAKAIRQSGDFEFDSGSNEAIIARTIALDEYDVVIWSLGEESTVDHTFDATEQKRVTHFLEQGGNLFVSGTEIGWELGRPGRAGLNFYNNQLVSKYVADDGGSYTAAGVAGTIFENISSLRFDNGQSIYNVEFPDSIEANKGSVINLNYTEPGVGGAAIQYVGETPERRLVMMAIPFETITEEKVRNTVMASVLKFLGLTKDVSIAAVQICDAKGNQTHTPVAVDMSTDVVTKDQAPSLLTQINELPTFKDNHWQLTQQPKTGQLRLTIDTTNYAVLPVRVRQQAKPAQLTMNRDGRVNFVTAKGREILTYPIAQNISGLCNALADSKSEVVWQENGLLSVKFKAYRAVARADLVSQPVSKDEPLGIFPTKDGHSVHLIFVDETGQKRQQRLHPFCAYPEALYDYQALVQKDFDLDLAHDGTVSFTLDGQRYHGIFDYVVHPSKESEKPPENGQLVFTPLSNKDKTVGFTVTYPTGETQMLRLKSDQ